MAARLCKVWKLLLRHYSVMACIEDFGSCKTTCESTERNTLGNPRHGCTCQSLLRDSGGETRDVHCHGQAGGHHRPGGTCEAE